MRISAGFLALAVMLSGCGLGKKLASSDAGEAGSAAASADGLPQECLDYLEVYKCAHAKSEPATAQSQADGLRAGFQALAGSQGAAAAKKQCGDLMATSQAGFAQIGCTKGAAAATAATPTAPATTAATATETTSAPAKSAADVVGTGPCKKGQSRIKGVCRVHCMNPGYCKPDEECREASFVDPKEGPITDNYCLPKGAASDTPAKPGPRAACPARTLRSKSGTCSISTCTKDEDCSTHACSLVRNGVRVCSGSIDEVDPSEFR